MSQENATRGQAADEKAALPPSNLPEELLPVYDWYRTQGRQIVLGVIVVLAVVLGVKAYLRYRDNQVAEASAALLSAESVEGLENLAGQYGKGKLGPLIQLQLAKAYYHAGNYAEAKAAYETILKSHPSHDLADTARIGLAASLEGESAFEEARKAFAGFADAKPDHYLYPLAIMGQARCLAALEQKPAALDLLDRLLVSHGDTPWEEMAKDLQGVIQRFDGFKSRSIFDQLGSAASKLQADGAPADASILDTPVVRPAAVATNASEKAAAPTSAP